MPRRSRIVVPDVAHHVTQRGNRRMPIFFSDADRRAYVAALGEQCRKHGTKCLAWCLMDNHIHLILVPASEDGLRATLARLHTRYAARVNKEQGWTGHLFEGRFWSYPMDESHLMIAVRYIELNPVTAGLVAHAEDWAWSSARAHIEGKGDDLTDMAALASHVSNWRAYLAEGVEAADKNEAIELALRSGIAMGRVDWVSQFGRIMRKRGRPYASAPIKGDSHL
jgi:putative transposase